MTTDRKTELFECTREAASSLAGGESNLRKMATLAVQRIYADKENVQMEVIIGEIEAVRDTAIKASRRSLNDKEITNIKKAFSNAFSALRFIAKAWDDEDMMPYHADLIAGTARVSSVYVTVSGARRKAKKEEEKADAEAARLANEADKGDATAADKADIKVQIDNLISLLNDADEAELVRARDAIDGLRTLLGTALALMAPTSADATSIAA